MSFKVLMLVHLCISFPLKCPEPAQWAQRANGHCAVSSKYFCLKNDLTNGYSENCTRSDFQQPGRKAVLRGGIDADTCSVERYQPFPIKFFTNTSTNCIFLKSFCNEEGQVVYDHGNRNTDTTCRCDYRRGYDFLVKPNNPCFCKPSQEDCSCFFKTCTNTGNMSSYDYKCIYITDGNLVTQCRPITDEEDISRKKTKILEITQMDHIVSSAVKWNHRAAKVLLGFMCGTCVVMVTLVFFNTVIQRLLYRICLRVYFIDEPEGDSTLYEGESFELKYMTSRRQWDVKIYKNDIVVEDKDKRSHVSIKHVNIEDQGRYYAECYGLRSKYTILKVLPLEIKGPEPNLCFVEGETLELQYELPKEGLPLNFKKNCNYIAELENVRKEYTGLSNVLTILNVTPKDEGLYLVEVNTIRSKATKVTVQSMFTSTFDPIDCIEGDELQLKCTVYSEKYGVEWFKDDVKIKENENTIIHCNENNHLITFKQAKVSDSGQYCIVAGNVKKQLKTTVKALFKCPLKSKTIMEELGVNFECEIEKPCEVQWYKDDKRIKPSPNIVIDKQQEGSHKLKLSILKTTFEDKGKYEIKINHIISSAYLDVKEMPDAIKQMSDQDRSLFLEAAKNGTALRYNIRIIIVGKHEAGKTCLLRRLMNEDIVGVESTDGINIEVKKCKINLKTQEWIFPKSNESSLTEYPNDQYADCGFWDFAGQKEFYATHQTFLSRNAIYLLVVDVSEDFEKNTFETMIETQFKKTGDYINFWLDNIHCYTVNDADDNLKSNSLNPPVLIIGTGIDKVQNIETKEDAFKDYINKLLLETPKRKHLRTLRFLSNTKPSNDKKEFQTLRDDIFDKANEIPKWGDNLPTRWILFEKEIERLIVNGNVVISYDMAKDLAAKCSFSLEEVTMELDLFLKYEHEIGNLIFFDDIKSYIILEPKWLVDVFRCFVSPFKFQSESMNMSEWSRLQLTGNLPDCLIDKLFTKVPMLDSADHKLFALQIMEKFDIIVKPLTTEKKEEYYIPCMIMASTFNDILDTFNVRNVQCSRTAWFGLQFNFLPPAFFNHIVVTFLKKLKLCSDGKGRQAIYRGICVFDLDFDESNCQKLIVCLSENSVSMQVWRFQNGKDLCYHEYSKFLTKIVDLLQHKYRINVPYKQFLKCPEGIHHEKGERLYIHDVSKKANNYHEYCTKHASHTVEELCRFWFEGEEDFIGDKNGNTSMKCHYCENMPKYRCYECSYALCKVCYLTHDELVNEKDHTIQSTKDKMLLNSTFKVSDGIVDTKSLPGGLLVIVVLNNKKVLTYSVSEKQRNEISVGGKPCSIAILDRNTVVVLLTHAYETIDSIEIVDIRQKQIIQHVPVTIDLQSIPFCAMFYTDDQLYISNSSGITVMNTSGKTDREINLGFRPSDMCYDTKATRIYCINDVGNTLTCIDRDGKTIFTITDTDPKRVSIDNEGHILVLCHEVYDVNFKVQRISCDGKSSELAITGKRKSDISNILFLEESDEVVISFDKTVYFYKTK